MDARALRNIALLPETARAKLQELELARMGAEDAARAATTRLNALPGDADPPMIARLEAEAARQRQRHGQLHPLCSKLTQWLAELRPVVLEAVPPVSVELKGEKPSAALAAVRGEISALHGKLARVRSAPLTRDEESALIEDYVVRLIRQAEPSVGIVGGRLRVNFKGDMFASEDVLALLAWAAPDPVCRALERALPESDGNDALSAAERGKRVAEIEARLLELERREEALIELAQADGIEVMRRSDASPLCVLGLVIKQAAPAVAQVA
jgi:hypothetical protein